MKDLGDKITDKEKEEAEDKVKELEKEIEKEDFDVDEVKKLKESLQEVTMKLATKVYENVQKEQASNNEEKEDKEN